MTDQEHLRQWLADRPFISVSAISKAMGWDRRVLRESLVGHIRPLTDEELREISSLLMKYGYENKYYSSLD